MWLGARRSITIEAHTTPNVNRLDSCVNTKPLVGNFSMVPHRARTNCCLTLWYICSLKFHPGKPVFLNGTRDFPTAQAAASSPLATAIFRISGISNVFFGADFVTVTKTDSLPWENVKPAIADTIKEFFASGEPIIVDEEETPSEIDEDTSEASPLARCWWNRRE